MNDIAIGELLVRMVVSLGIVLLLVLVAYLVVKRRVSGGGGGGLARLGSSLSGLRQGRGDQSARPTREPTSGRARPGTSRNALKVLGRAGVGRSSNVMAVQFADRVLLLGATDGSAPVLLSDVDLFTWEVAAATDDERNVRTTPVPIDQDHTARGARSSEQSDAVSASLGLIEALREATARRV